VLVITVFGSRMVGMPLRDEIAVVFCGSKKTLASGVPMANVLFPPASVGLVVLPLMIYHQIQLFVCAVLARKFAVMMKKHEAEKALLTPAEVGE
jgi:sodium/bile acid cotransporter 7